MTTKSTIAGLIVVPGVVVAAIGGTLYLSHHDAPAGSGANDSRPAAADSTGVPDGTQAAAVPDAACEPRAVPSFRASADERIVQIAKRNPASQADTGTPEMTASDAIRRARLMSTAAQTAAAGGTTPDVDALPAAVVQAPFAEADAWLGGETASDANSLIAPTRCTWAVTVHAPFTPRSVPYGKKAISYDSYTVLFDRNSGQYLGVSAGTDAADLITGDRAGR